MAKKGLNSVSTTDLQTELRRRASRLRTLERKREKLQTQLEEVDAEIDEVGGAFIQGAGRRGAGGGRRRPRNEMNLEDSLQKLLKNKTMGVTEAAEAVQEAGYKTTSASFRTIVNQTLINSPKFKRVSRGQYTAK